MEKTTSVAITLEDMKLVEQLMKNTKIKSRQEIVHVALWLMAKELAKK